MTQRTAAIRAPVPGRPGADIARTRIQDARSGTHSLGPLGQAGNQALLGLLRAGMLQAKMAVSQPGDPWEQEADRVADAVLRMPAPPAATVNRHGPPLQRMCAQCASGRGLCPECAARARGRLAASSGGEALSPSARSYFEPRFGRDISHVRVHTDAGAGAAAQALQAQAFTVGADIWFAPGRYQPETETGRRLLAHELTHTMQQGAAGRVQRKLAVEDPPGSPANAPPGVTNETIVADYLQTLCPGTTVSGGEVKPEPERCGDPAASGAPVSCQCICEMDGLSDTWTIQVNDDAWPHTNPATRTVTVHSPFSGVEFGHWTRGPSPHEADIPNWLALGHELCGHAHLMEQRIHPPRTPPSHGGRTDHDDTIAVQNQIATEHGIPASERRGTHADPHHGESFARITVSHFPFASADVSRLPPEQHSKLDLAAGFITRYGGMVDLIGHADQPTRSASANLQISRERARNVRRALRDRGVPNRDILVQEGVSDSVCAAPGQQPACRKVEIRIFGREGASVGHRDRRP